MKKILAKIPIRVIDIKSDTRKIDGRGLVRYTYKTTCVCGQPARWDRVFYSFENCVCLNCGAVHSVKK